jgi:hypothetical protein
MGLPQDLWTHDSHINLSQCPLLFPSLEINMSLQSFDTYAQNLMTVDEVLLACSQSLCKWTGWIQARGLCGKVREWCWSPLDQEVESIASSLFSWEKIGRYGVTLERLWVPMCLSLCVNMCLYIFSFWEGLCLCSPPDHELAIFLPHHLLFWHYRHDYHNWSVFHSLTLAFL